MTCHLETDHLVLAHDNVFFFLDGDGVRDFAAMVWAKAYGFDQITSLTVGLRTPAQQLIWREARVALPVAGPEAAFDGWAPFARPSDYVVRWLDANAPGWATAPAGRQDRNPALFFAEVAHARAFVAEVDRLLAGLHLS